MNEAQVRTVEQMREVLVGTHAVQFNASGEDADRYRWRFAGLAGRQSGHVLGLDAPEEPGRYRLYVRHGRWADAADVIVAAPPEQP